jgi:hypothetical protein
MKKALLAVLILTVLLATLHYASASDVTRSFSSTSVDYKEDIAVTLDVDVTGSETLYAIIEQVPSNWLIHSYWDTSNYCSSEVCGNITSTCGVSPCANRACDLSTGSYCNSGTWETSNYCDALRCGNFTSTCGVSPCSNNACDIVNKQWCNQGTWTSSNYDQECSSVDSERCYMTGSICTNVCSNNACDVNIGTRCFADTDGGRTIESGYIKWVVPSGAQDTTYSYAVRAPDQENTYLFTGEYIFEGMPTEDITLGQTSVTVNNPCADVDGDTYDNCNIGEPGDDGKVIDCDDDPGQCGSACNPGITEGAPGQEDQHCDGYDNDCVGGIDQHTKTCGSDVGECSVGWQRCDAGLWGTCNDEQGPDTEICNTLDDDCDGTIDDVSDPSTCQCYDGGTPYVNELCPLNNIDDDCNSLIDDVNCGCSPGAEQPCDLQLGVCSGSNETCPAGGMWLGCNESVYLSFNPNYQEGNESTCDGLNNDCDSQTDEDVTTEYYRDQDGDGYGDLADTTDDCTQPGGYVSNSQDCDDTNTSINPDATEVCNGVDDNCDSNVDFLLIPGDLGCTGPIVVTNIYYDGSTTDFGAVSDFSDIPSMTMERTEYGKIVFTENINITFSINIDPPSTIIEYNKAMINATRLPMLNKSASISLYNITLNNPTILRDGSECSSSVCTLIDYINDVFEFSVTRFSEYSTQGRCDDGTWYDQCVFDRTGNDGDRPAYCEDGTIVNRASACGCPSGQTPSGEDCVTPSTNGNGGNGNGGGSGCFEGQTNDCNPSGLTAGVCSAGVQTCSGGLWSSCVGAVEPSDEVCDGLDNDCDGETDESLDCLCFHGDTRPCGSSMGICEEGRSTCNLGVWGGCYGGVPAEVVENCSNNLDDDCDGEINNGCENIAQTCFNGILNDNEDGVDCGGVCLKPCPLPFEIPSYTGLLLIIAGLVVLFVIVLLDLWKAKRGY